MSVVKERMTEVIQDQPEDSSYEEILRELAFKAMITRGLKDSSAGKKNFIIRFQLFMNDLCLYMIRIVNRR